MQNVRFNTFIVSNSLTRSVLHFFPAASSTPAPYPVRVTLSLSGTAFEKKSVTLDGARLGQPDGVRLEDAFKELADGFSGFLSLTVDISSQQHRLDLSNSRCVIEINNSAQTVRYSPRLIEVQSNTAENNENYYNQSFACLQDAFCFTSLLIINAGTEVFQPKLTCVSNATKTESLSLNTVLPGTVYEVGFPENSFIDVEPVECSWGLSRSKIVHAEPYSQDNISMYVVYKDIQTKRIISVVPL